MLSEAILDRARARLGQPPFAAAAARLRAAQREDLARPVIVPPPDQPAGYYHDYFCPEHGVQLVFDWRSPRAHRCPVDGAIYRGQPYDRSWWWFVNHEHSDAAFRLALSWRLQGERPCLDQAAAILRAYAAHYPEAGWPAGDPRPRQGKVAYHALDEAVWLIPLAWAYHLIRPALGEGARREVETRLFQPAAAHLMAQRWPQVHNYMCWLNAAVAGAASLLNRPDLLAAVVDGPYGFRQQVEAGVLADGTWWEGSASYHFYTLAALLALLRSLPEVAQHGRAPSAGALRRLPKLRQMWLAPLRWAYPDLTLPALNDCWYHSSLVGECGHGIPPAAAFYEIGAGWYGDAAFHYVLAAAYARGQARDSLEALIFGPDDVAGPTERTPAGGAGTRQPRLLTTSANLAELGVAVLRGPNRRAERDEREVVVARPAPGSAGMDRRTFLLLKYGPHGGGHGHPDKLGIVLFAEGERLSPDLGTPGYGIALNDCWYRHTLSHNTVLLDGQRQPPAAGRLLAFAPRRATRRATGDLHRPRRPEGYAGFGVIDAAVEWPADEPAAGAYRGARFRRIVLARPSYFLDLYLVSCPSDRQIDWAYHHRGQLTYLGPPAAVPPPAGASTGTPAGLPAVAVPEPVRPRLAQQAAGDVLAAFATGAAALHLWLAGMDGLSGGAEPWVIAADAPANPASETLALLLRRCRAADVLFAALFHPFRAPGGPAIRAVTWQRMAAGLACRVETRRGSERWEIAWPPEIAAVARLGSAARGVRQAPAGSPEGAAGPPPAGPVFRYRPPANA